MGKTFGVTISLPQVKEKDVAWTSIVALGVETSRQICDQDAELREYVVI